MVKKKADYPKVTLRTTREMITRFNKWFRGYKKEYPFVTKNLILAEAFYKISRGFIKFSWEKSNDK